MASFYHDLIDAARQALAQAYAPYSRFRVGASVMDQGGGIFIGTNVENSVYGLSICAERIAIGHAVSSGARKLKVLCVVTPEKKLVYPCGACRQVFADFAVPQALVVVALAKSKEHKIIPLTKLLPHSFHLASYGARFALNL